MLPSIRFSFPFFTTVIVSISSSSILRDFIPSDFNQDITISSTSPIVSQDEALSSTFSALRNFNLLDQGDYSDTNAIINTEGNPDISDPIRLKLSIATSKQYLAGTVNTITATFVGDFASSGPHSLDTFAQGEKKEILISVSRIGNLKEIIFRNMGTDGWLLGNVQCQIEDQLYILSATNHWVDSYDPVLYATTGNGYEPGDQLQLHAAPSLHVPVQQVVQMYSLNGNKILVD